MSEGAGGKVLKWWKPKCKRLHECPYGLGEADPSQMSKRRMKMKMLVTQSCPTLCDPLDCSPQAPLSTEFSRQEY